MLYMLNQAESRGQSMTKSQKDRLNRLERIKIKVDRNNVLDSAKGLFLSLTQKMFPLILNLKVRSAQAKGQRWSFSR